MHCAKHHVVCERDLEKPKQQACMKCASLKEKCEWPEVGGPGPVVDKGKGKAKEKEVAGPSGSRSGFNTGPFLEWMDRLTAVVEVMIRQMARIADSTWSVSRSNNRLSAGLETFFKECQFFTLEFVVSEEESEGEVDPEEIDQELAELQKDLEGQEGPVPE